MIRTLLTVAVWWLDVGLVVCLGLSALHFPRPEEDQ